MAAPPARRRGEVLVGVAAAVVVFVAVPAVLAIAAGWPFPRHWDRAGLVSWRGLFDALSVVAWLAWAGCAWPLLRGVWKRVRSHDMTRSPADRLVDRVALRIAVAILALAPAVGAATALGASGAGASGPRAPSAVVALGPATGSVVPPTVPTTLPSPDNATTPGAGDPDAAAGGDTQAAPGAGPAAATTAPTTAPPTTPGVTTGDTLGSGGADAGGGDGGKVGVAAAVPPAGSSWTVEPGDSLWSIADTTYGDGTQWPLISAANLGKAMDDGSTFTNPDVIQPGWVLDLPPANGAAPGPALAAAAVVPASGAPPALDDANPVPATSPEADRGAPGRSPAWTPAAASVAADAAGARASHPASAATSAATQPGARRPGPDEGPELAIVGLGALLAALLARRIRRERRLASFLRGEGQRSAPPDPSLAELATSVDGLADLPLVELIEAAWYQLGAADHDDAVEPGRRAAPGAHILRARPSGMELRLGTERHGCPEGWRPAGPGEWSFDMARPGSDETLAAVAAPWRPLLLPLGENDDGAWLVALDAGVLLSVLGPGATELIAALRAAALSWSWHEDVVVTATATLAASRSGVLLEGGPGSGPDWVGSRTGVLFTGDPRVLAPGVAARVATVTAEALPAALTVVVDDRGATVHPLGLVLAPHRLSALAARAVEQLMAGGGAPAAAETVALTPPQKAAPTARHDHPLPLVSDDERVTTRVSDRTAHTGRPRAEVAVGTRSRRPVVRLLTAVPRIDGLVAPLDPKRTRRAVELVAYLGTWHPDPVTGDRLRARVLGTADADAAAKTLFNTAGAARRALGFDDRGEHLLPLASRSGHYRLSPDVTVDAVQAGILLAQGISAEDATVGVDSVTEGLSMVEGEPMAGILTGYGWWRGEGHERRLSDVMVDGACRLVRLCVETGELDRARWAIDRARLVEPYSEALSRAAMVVAAATGDTGRLQREWDDCRHLMDELDPGGVPSDATERLYGRLRRQLSDGDPLSVGG